MNTLIIATKNKGKAEEFKQMLSPLGYQVKTLLDFSDAMPDIEETGTTFYENAQLKAEQIAAQLGKPVIADDSGLEVDYLDGAPGVYSARYSGEHANDEANNHKLLNALKDVQEKDRTAQFVCVLAFARPNETTIFKKGTCKGKITRTPTGENGFGYDPVFIPEGYEQTMAQLSQVEKNQLSHRYHALKAFRAWLEEQM